MLHDLPETVFPPIPIRWVSVCSLSPPYTVELLPSFMNKLTILTIFPAFISSFTEPSTVILINLSVLLPPGALPDTGSDAVMNTFSILPYPHWFFHLILLFLLLLIN